MDGAVRGGTCNWEEQSQLSITLSFHMSWSQSQEAPNNADRELPTGTFWICPLTTPLTNWLTRLSVPCSIQEQIDSRSPQNSEPRIAKTVPLVFFFLFCFVSIKHSCSPIFQVWVSRLVNPEPPFVVQNGWRVYDVPLSGKAKGVFCFLF